MSPYKNIVPVGGKAGSCANSKSQLKLIEHFSKIVLPFSLSESVRFNSDLIVILLGLKKSGDGKLVRKKNLALVWQQTGQSLLKKIDNLGRGEFFSTKEQNYC